MIYYQDSRVVIRSMREEDIHALLEALRAQGWHKPPELFAAYFAQQQAGTRLVFVAQAQGAAAGYATLLVRAQTGPFAGKGIPEICDFNVLIRFQRQGIGSLILDAAERAAASFGNTVSLGVGLHAGYGTAQRMYVKRGYLPDGTGVWYNDSVLTPYAACKNDDDLILYFSKRLLPQD